MYDILSVLDHYGLLKPNTEVVDENVKIVCPFHNEEVASMCIDLRRGFLHCFGCDWRGDIVDLVACIEKVDRLRAMLKMQKIRNVKRKIEFNTVDVKTKRELLEGAYIQYMSAPSVNWETLQDHYMIAQRHFTPRTLTKFGIKLEPGSINYPIMIPVYDNGKFVGLVRRRIDNVEEKKYINNKGFRKKSVLGGNYRPGMVMICEGPFDMMMANQYGYSNAVCIFGWKISRTQASKLSAFTDTVIDALDNSPKGREGGDVLRQHFKKVIRLVYPPRAKDICEMSKVSFRKSVIDSLS